MLDELKEEEIVNKVGGRFKLSTLIQKRMVALNTGAKPLVDTKSGDKLSIVLQEILQDKIYLDAAGNLHTSNMNITSNLPAVFLPGGGVAPAAGGAAGDE
ncbi:MAG TPA: DNA-directed RNA polymerase subunit omega [Gemmataceae bacterium]|jgi:DNA-directed RNA polymerase subunit omega|nr:DNA-directed RNA polymerase subunit omega [Gemmataceae bacterium]